MPPNPSERSSESPSHDPVHPSLSSAHGPNDLNGPDGPDGLDGLRAPREPSAPELKIPDPELEISQPLAPVSASTPPAVVDDLGELTCDPILRGRLRLWQPRYGYRFSVDPLLLADFTLGSGEPAEREPLGQIADLGAGVGIVGLALAASDPAARVTLVELQPRLAALCRKNLVENGMTDRCQVVQGDVLAVPTRRLLPGAGFDLVVSCPPYYPLGRGGLNPGSEEAIARHELRLPLGELVRASRRLIGFRGRVTLVYPSPRLAELLSALVQSGLQPSRLRLVHPRPGEPAQRVLVEACKGSRGALVIEPPLFLRDASGAYTKEARRALGEPQ